MLQAFNGTCSTLKFRKNGICFVLQCWTTDKRLFVSLGLLRHLFLHHSIPHSAPLFIPVSPAVWQLWQSLPTPALIWHPVPSRGCEQATVAPHAPSYVYVRHLLWEAHGTRTLKTGGGVRASENMRCRPDILALTDKPLQMHSCHSHEQLRSGGAHSKAILNDNTIKIRKLQNYMIFYEIMILQ